MVTYIEKLLNLVNILTGNAEDNTKPDCWRDI